MTGDDRAGPAIELTDLTKRYRGRTAVDRLCLSIPAGSTFGLIGPNGAGKSSTIKMLMGMLSITSGSARVLGIDVASEPLRVKQRVGYVPEVHHIYRWMLVGEVVGFARSFYETWNDAYCARLLDLFELDVHKRVKHLSKGMLAKLGLILAVAHEPDLLILDEPMSGMDPLGRDEFLDGVVRTLCERRCTVLFSSHTLSDVQRLADEVGILHEGRLLVHCGVDELLTSTKRVNVVLKDGCLPRSEPDGMVWQSIQRHEWSLTVRGFTPEVARRIQAENPVEAITIRDLNLEEVFKDYVKGRRPSP
jgi:ABC-2 type transport system ATP-binding protein